MLLPFDSLWKTVLGYFNLPPPPPSTPHPLSPHHPKPESTGLKSQQQTHVHSPPPKQQLPKAMSFVFGELSNGSSDELTRSHSLPHGPPSLHSLTPTHNHNDSSYSNLLACMSSGTATPADYIQADELAAIIRLATATSIMEEAAAPAAAAVDTTNGAPVQEAKKEGDAIDASQASVDGEGGEEEGGISKRMLKKMAKGKLKEKKDKKLP